MIDEGDTCTRTCRYKQPVQAIDKATATSGRQRHEKVVRMPRDAVLLCRAPRVMLQVSFRFRPGLAVPRLERPLSSVSCAFVDLGSFLLLVQPPRLRKVGQVTSWHLLVCSGSGV